ncbi:MAG: permease-like cell division protein FtsX [Lutispora sp.]|nr:permease-like cell division protein FtsX [Lutispora sp.]MDD4834473.1 permease-like cell division protein FtsX [Lutispora sp.]
MKARTVKYFFKQSTRSIWRNKVMSLASIGSVMAALLVIGIFLILVLNVDYLATKLESQVEIKVHLMDGLSENIINDINKDIKEIAGVKDSVFLSKDEALKKFNEELGENSYLLEGLEGDNPLSDSFIVTLEDPRLAPKATLAISAMSNIEKVVYGKEELEKLLNITYILRVGSLVIVGILFLISIFIISNTIKLTVFARRREIGIMKYIGATDWFVRGPFFFEGILLGLIGCIASIIILGAGYYFIANYIKQQMFGLLVISLMPFSEVIYSLIVALLVIGIIIGSLGSMISIRKFLKV